MYPSSPTTYKLPFDDTVRVSSHRQFILVRQFNGADSKPFIKLRSDDLAKLVKVYDPATDYIIDQARARISYHFNGKQEFFDGIEGKHIAYVAGPFIASSRKQAI